MGGWPTGCLPDVPVAEEVDLEAEAEREVGKDFVGIAQ